MWWQKQRLARCALQMKEGPPAKESRQPLEEFKPGSGRTHWSFPPPGNKHRASLRLTLGARSWAGQCPAAPSLPGWTSSTQMGRRWCLCQPWGQIALSNPILLEINFIFLIPPPPNENELKEGQCKKTKSWVLPLRNILLWKIANIQKSWNNFIVNTPKLNNWIVQLTFCYLQFITYPSVSINPSYLFTHISVCCFHQYTSSLTLQHTYQYQFFFDTFN